MTKTKLLSYGKRASQALAAVYTTAWGICALAWAVYVLWGLGALCWSAATEPVEKPLSQQTTSDLISGMDKSHEAADSAGRLLIVLGGGFVFLAVSSLPLVAFDAIWGSGDDDE